MHGPFQYSLRSAFALITLATVWCVAVVRLDVPLLFIAVSIAIVASATLVPQWILSRIHGVEPQWRMAMGIAAITILALPLIWRLTSLLIAM